MEITTHYRSLKPYLFATAYNITGQVHEAEDIIQDAFEDVLKKKDEDVQNLKSYLTRIVINKSIDRLNTLKKARENYPSLWLPEPYITESENPQSSDILPYAFLFLLELLNPVERAVFILRESFGKSYDEIASLCGVTVDNCRQVLRRARVKIKQAAQSPDAGKGPSSEQLVQEFLSACLTNNTTRLSELLKRDVILYSDGGGKVAAARKILEGFSKVTKFLTGIISKTFEMWSGARHIIVNNQPALLISDGNGVYTVLIPQAEGGKLARLFIMRNPDKIFLSDRVTK